MVRILRNNFLLFPAAIVAALLYSGLFPARRVRPYSALIPLSDAVYADGMVIDNPVRTGGGRYRIRLALKSVASGEGLFSEASGEVDVLVPESLYEVHQPGKLYSAARRGGGADFLLSKGARAAFALLPLSSVSSGSAFSRPNYRPQFLCGEILSCSYGRSLWGRVQNARALARLHWTRLMFAWGRAGGFLLALLSGAREYLEGDAALSFRNAGLSHILALSGMHLSLFGGIALFLGKRSLGKKIAPAVECAAVLLFVWFAGRTPSLFRALLCSCAAMLCGVLGLRVKSMINLLSGVFLIHAAVFPADVFEMSFILSYASLFGILGFNEFAAKPLCRKIPYAAGFSLGQSAGAQFLTAPISARVFGLWTPGGILASSVISPLVTVFVYAGLLCALLCLLFPAAASACGFLLNGIYRIISGAVNLFAAIPAARF